MNCPYCNKQINIDETANQFFLGRNSQGIPFFKCEECGNLFYVKNESVYQAIRREKGHRFVPITYAVLEFLIAVIIFHFFGKNIITWIIGGLLLWLGWSSIKIGLFGSQKLVNEMCLDKKTPLSKEVERECKEMHKIE